MESTNEKGENSLLKTQVTRRTTLTAAAWSAPVIAVAAATPAAVASEPFNPQADLEVAALGGAEGRYAPNRPYTEGVVAPNNNFRRMFSVTNTGEGTFNGSLRIDFTFPRMWNQAGVGGDADAFNNWGTVDLGYTGGASIGGVTPWTVGPDAPSYTQNTGDYAWTDVWLRNDPAHFTLTNVSLPPGGTIYFAPNANVPDSWIGDTGVYINPGNPNPIYWRSEVDITATTTGGDNLGTYRTPVGSWTNGIWYFNGGGPYAYEDPATGIYPAYGTA